MRIYERILYLTSIAHFFAKFCNFSQLQNIFVIFITIIIWLTIKFEGIRIAQIPIILGLIFDCLFKFIIKTQNLIQLSVYFLSILTSVSLFYAYGEINF